MKMIPNLLEPMPWRERVLRSIITSAWQAMSATGKGYRKFSLRHSGRVQFRRAGEEPARDCRRDKAVHPLPLAKAMRGYRSKYG